MFKGPLIGKVRRVHLAFAGLCLLIIHAPLGAKPYKEWIERERSPDIIIYTQDLPDSDVDLIKGTVRLKHSPQKVAAILMSAKRQTEFVPHNKGIHLLKWRRLPNGRIEQLIHQKSSVPVLSDRDVILKTLTWSEKNHHGETWRSSFVSVKNEGPKPEDGFVRLSILRKAAVRNWSITRMQSLVVFCRAGLWN